MLTKKESETQSSAAEVKSDVQIHAELLFD